MKKRIVAWFLIFILCLSIAFPSFGEDAFLRGQVEISNADIIFLAQSLLSEKFELFPKLTATGQMSISLENGTEAFWLVEFENREAFYGKYKVELSYDGTQFSLTEPDTMLLPGDNSKDDDTGVPAVLHDYDVSMEQAKQSAIQIVQEKYHKSNQDMKQYTIDACFIYDYRFCNGWEPVWLISFNRDSKLDFKVLLGYEENNNKYIIPGGGLEDGETYEQCCERELLEETGMQVRAKEEYLEIEELFLDWNHINHYFVCDFICQIFSGSVYKINPVFILGVKRFN